MGYRARELAAQRFAFLGCADVLGRSRGAQNVDRDQGAATSPVEDVNLGDLFAGVHVMISPLRRLHIFLATIVLVLAVVKAPLAIAQQGPSNAAGPVVTEEQLLQEHGRIQGRISIPDQRESVLEQPIGRQWRVYHEVLLNWFGGAVILGVSALLAVFYLVRGPIRIEGGRSGRTIVRFDGFERFVHWLAGVSFIVLALTGLNFTYGKKLVLPLVGPEAFTMITEVGKYAHNFLSFPFVLGVAAMFLLWVRDNFPTAADIEWFKQGGGFVGNSHPPAWRFNGGQKLLFWGMTIGTVLIAVPGYMLIFPFYFANIAGMQIAEIVHSIGAIVFIAAIIAHVYIASLGMEGGFDAMADGNVDLNWAKQHHRLWVEQEMGEKLGTSTTPAAAAAE
jgi:formate dehydrogenase subunit gamma